MAPGFSMRPASCGITGDGLIPNDQGRQRQWRQRKQKSPQVQFANMARSGKGKVGNASQEHHSAQAEAQASEGEEGLSHGRQAHLQTRQTWPVRVQRHHARSSGPAARSTAVGRATCAARSARPYASVASALAASTPESTPARSCAATSAAPSTTSASLRVAGSRRRTDRQNGVGRLIDGVSRAVGAFLTTSRRRLRLCLGLSR